METFKKITVSTQVNAGIDHVWKVWTTPADINQWNTASPDWHTTKAENDLRVGGKFSSRMEAKDGSFGFDFSGIYDQIKPKERIEYTMEDGRRSIISFFPEANGVRIDQTFDAENENTLELQQNGWQAIMDSFKKHAENEK